MAEHADSQLAGVDLGDRSPLAFTLQTKGVVGLVGRVCTVASRFRATPRAMAGRLDEMVQVIREHGALPTLPITATVLERNQAWVQPFVEQGVEFAVHGLYHNDHAREDLSTQLADMRRAIEIFRTCGIDPHGFRAPYLRANASTPAAVRDTGMTYQSDDSVVFDIAALGPYDLAGDAYLRALMMYAAKDATTSAARPSLVDDLVRIPVCLPDDEMLVDRLHLDAQECADIWCAVLDATHDRGDLFTMQVHPERFDRVAAPVGQVLTRAAGMPNGVWIAQLRDIADWWRSRAACRLTTARAGEHDLTVSVNGDARAVVQVVGPGATSLAVPGARSCVTLPADPFPGIGIAADAPEPLRAFLRDEGHLTTVSDGGMRCALHLDNDTDVSDEVGLRRRIQAAAAPVVTVGRWPNGYRSALAITGDIDAFTVQDFVRRLVLDRRRHGPRSPYIARHEIAR